MRYTGPIDLPKSSSSLASSTAALVVVLMLCIQPFAVQAQEESVEGPASQRDDGQGGQDVPGRSEAGSTVGGEGEAFSDLLGNSPFLRRVDLSRSLVLRGIADIEGVKVAVLVDRDTKKTHFVGGDKNEDGWSLLEIEGNLEEMSTVSAKLSVTGGEVISVAYAEAQINPLAAPVGKTVPRDQIKSVAHEARNFRQGMSADGYPNPPPKHVVDRFSKLNESQRMRIIYEMRGHYKNGKGTRERQQIFDGMVNRALRQRQ